MDRFQRSPRGEKPVIGFCRLCGNEADLVEGHFIPGFVYRWLKATSVGAIRSSAVPDRRVQDGPQDYLLCARCDGGVLSALETHFKDTVFDPLHSARDSDETIHVDEEIQRFAVAQSWRALLFFEAQGGYDSVPLEYIAPLRAAGETWRAFIKGESDHLGECVQHVIPLAGVVARGHRSPYLHRYLRRAVHSQVLFGGQEIWAYSKLGDLVIIGVVSEGDGSRGMQGTLLSPDTTIAGPPREYGVPKALVRFWEEEADELAKKMSGISEKQKAKISERFKTKAPEEVLNSQTVDAMFQDFLWSGEPGRSIYTSPRTRKTSRQPRLVARGKAKRQRRKG